MLDINVKKHGGEAVYGLGFIGAAIYYISVATGFCPSATASPYLPDMPACPLAKLARQSGSWQAGGMPGGDGCFGVLKSMRLASFSGVSRAAVFRKIKHEGSVVHIHHLKALDDAMQHPFMKTK